jgi:hypothetical protein
LRGGLIVVQLGSADPLERVRIVGYLAEIRSKVAVLGPFDEIVGDPEIDVGSAVVPVPDEVIPAVVPKAYIGMAAVIFEDALAAIQPLPVEPSRLTVVQATVISLHHMTEEIRFVLRCGPFRLSRRVRLLTPRRTHEERYRGKRQWQGPARSSSHVHRSPITSSP